MEHEPESARGRAGVPREKYSYPAAGAGATDPPALHADGGVPPGRGPATRRIGALLLAAGGWLLLAPFALSYSAAVATASDVIAGGLLAAVALAALVAPARMRWLGLVAAALGAWVVLAPFVLFYAARTAGDDAVWNDLVVGTVVVVLGLFGALTRRRA
ncbi:MAG TPA: SPW repeat protein [Pseudonocardia sp.]|nr:SPW repeat protein [Pseudonocardia sp.]